MVSSLMQQIPLPLRLESNFTFDNFLCSEALINQIKSTIFEPKSLKIIGNIGKTHLLQALCHFAQKNQHKFHYLPLKNYPEMLEFTPEFDLICVDDIDLIAGDYNAEKNLFDLFNKADDLQKSLILSSKNLVNNFNLPDLNSRINTLKIIKLSKLSDENIKNALKLHAKHLGINLDQKVVQYLLTHSPRNLKVIIGQLEKLSEASIIQKRIITIPFVKKYC